MVDSNVKIIEELKSFLNTLIEEPEIRELFTTNPRDFIRDRKLPLKKVIGLLINLPKRSISIELQSFFEALVSASFVAKLCEWPYLCNLIKEFCTTTYESQEQIHGNTDLAPFGKSMKIF